MEGVYYHLTQEGNEYLKDILQDYYTLLEAIIIYGKFVINRLVNQEILELQQ